MINRFKRYKWIGILFILNVNSYLYSQEVSHKNPTQLKFDVQLLGNSPIYSFGLIIRNTIFEKSLIDVRAGFGFYFENNINKTPTIDSNYYTEFKKWNPAFSIPLEITFRPNYLNNKISYSLGASYNFFKIDYISHNMQDFKYYPKSLNRNRLFLTLGADYHISKKIKLGLRLMTIVESQGLPNTIPIIPYPSFNYTF